MALYSYHLHLVRELGHGDLFAEMLAGGLLDPPSSAPDEEDRIQLLRRAPAFFRQVQNRAYPSCPLQIVSFDLDVDPFEQLLMQESRLFLDWLWRVAEVCNLACAFMPGGGDFKYYVRGRTTDEVIFWQLGELVETGNVEIVHPVMYFAERLGVAHRQAVQARWPVNESKQGVGCLLLLASIEEPGGMEILEPGVIYEELRARFLGSSF